MGDTGGFVALSLSLVKVAPLRCNCVNSAVASVVYLGGRCIGVGGVKVLDQMVCHGGGEGGGVYCW